MRYRFSSQVNARELPQRRRVVQGLFHRRVRQIEPLLQEINPQHLFQFFWPSPVPWFRIVRLNQGAQLSPRPPLLHLFQEHCPPRLLRIPLESRHHRQCPLLTWRFHLALLYLYSLWKRSTYSESPYTIRSISRPTFRVGGRVVY